MRTLIPIVRNHSDRQRASNGFLKPFHGGGGNRTRETFRSDRRCLADLIGALRG